MGCAGAKPKPPVQQQQPPLQSSQPASAAVNKPSQPVNSAPPPPSQLKYPTLTDNQKEISNSKMEDKVPKAVQETKKEVLEEDKVKSQKSEEFGQKSISNANQFEVNIVGNSKVRLSSAEEYMNASKTQPVKEATSSNLKLMSADNKNSKEDEVYDESFQNFGQQLLKNGVNLEVAVPHKVSSQQNLKQNENPNLENISKSKSSSKQNQQNQNEQQLQPRSSQEKMMSKNIENVHDRNQYIDEAVPDDEGEDFGQVNLQKGMQVTLF